MIEPWLGSFLIGFLGIIIAILILHEAAKWGCLGMILLFLAFLFWGYTFDFYPIRSLPTGISPSQNLAGRLGVFLGAASSCIWLDASKGEKIRMLISVNSWGRFIIVTAIYFVGTLESTLIFSDSTPFTAMLIGLLPSNSDNDSDNNEARCVITGLVLFIATTWIWWHWDTSGYALSIHNVDTTKNMFSTLLITSLFYGRSDILTNSAIRKLESISKGDQEKPSNK